MRHSLDGVAGMTMTNVGSVTLTCRKTVPRGGLAGDGTRRGEQASEERK